MGPNDNSAIIVDQRYKMKHGAPSGNVAILRLREKYEEMPFRAGVFHAWQNR
jgi:hypothetical protein